MEGGQSTGQEVARGLLVIGGACPPAEVLREAAKGVDLIAAADEGLVAVLRAGLVPDIVAGDMDSLPDASLLDGIPSSRLFRFPRDKDETDTEIGVRLLHERGCHAITIAGGGGGRIDHLLAIASLFERPDPPVRWITDSADIHLVDRDTEFLSWRGSTVSVFPLGERAASLHSEGLLWPLDGLEFRPGFGGISNRTTGARVRITVGIGKLLVVRSESKD